MYDGTLKSPSTCDLMLDLFHEPKHIPDGQPVIAFSSTTSPTIDQKKLDMGVHGSANKKSMKRKGAGTLAIYDWQPELGSNDMLQSDESTGDDIFCLVDSKPTAHTGVKLQSYKKVECKHSSQAREF